MALPFYDRTNPGRDPHILGPHVEISGGELDRSALVFFRARGDEFTLFPETIDSEPEAQRRRVDHRVVARAVVIVDLRSHEKLPNLELVDQANSIHELPSVRRRRPTRLLLFLPHEFHAGSGLDRQSPPDVKVQSTNQGDCVDIIRGI
jgi:hypothetical protein